jgi:amino acid transporter
VHTNSLMNFFSKWVTIHSWIFFLKSIAIASITFHEIVLFFFFLHMHDCVNIYFSNKNKNYVNEPPILGTNIKFYTNSLVDESPIFINIHQFFLWMTQLTSLLFLGMEVKFLMNSMVDKSLIYRDEHWIICECLSK